MASTIRTVEVFPVAMPLVGSFTSGGKSKSVTRCAVVRVTDTDGCVGTSSIDPSTRAVSPNTALDLAIAIRERIGPAAIGIDPRHINRINELAVALAPNQPGARAGIELACVDLVCRRQGIGLHDYVGGPVMDRVLFNGWIGELPPEDAAAEARRWQQAGFGSVKIKVGNVLDTDAARIAAVRDAVGAGMKLRMDANQQCTVDQAIALCRAVKDCDIQLFEQPTPKEDLAGLAQVRREGGIAIMADEAISDHQSLIRVIKADCADFVKFGITQAGGLSASARMIATAAAAGLRVVLGHGFGLDPSTTAEIMLGATSKNVLAGLECVGPLKVADSVVTTRLDIGAGHLDVPDGPGLGLVLDEAKLREYALEETEPA